MVAFLSWEWNCYLSTLTYTGFKFQFTLSSQTTPSSTSLQFLILLSPYLELLPDYWNAFCHILTTELGSFLKQWVCLLCWGSVRTRGCPPTHTQYQRREAQQSPSGLQSPRITPTKEAVPLRRRMCTLPGQRPLWGAGADALGWSSGKCKEERTTAVGWRNGEHIHSLEIQQWARYWQLMNQGRLREFRVSEQSSHCITPGINMQAFLSPRASFWCSAMKYFGPRWSKALKERRWFMFIGICIQPSRHSRWRPEPARLWKLSWNPRNH